LTETSKYILIAGIVFVIVVVLLFIWTARQLKRQTPDLASVRPGRGAESSEESARDALALDDTRVVTAHYEAATDAVAQETSAPVVAAAETVGQPLAPSLSERLPPDVRAPAADGSVSAADDVGAGGVGADAVAVDEQAEAQTLNRATADLLEALANTLQSDSSSDAGALPYDFREQMMRDKELEHSQAPVPRDASGPAAGPDPAVSARLADMRELGALRARQVQSSVTSARASDGERSVAATALPVDPWPNLPGTSAAVGDALSATDAAGFVADGLAPGAYTAADGARVRWPWESVEPGTVASEQPAARADPGDIANTPPESPHAPPELTAEADSPVAAEADSPVAAESTVQHERMPSDPAAFFSARLTGPDVLGWFTVYRDGEPALHAEQYDDAVHRTFAALADGALRAATLVGLSAAGAFTVQGPEGLISIRPVCGWFPERSDYLVVFLQDSPQALSRLDAALSP